jgi:3-hydroxyisobutyrate dehydrogenase
MGTIAVAESQQLESEVRQAGGRYLEAPVLGSTPEAKAGTLLLMVGGAKPLFDELSPLLSELTDQPRYIGGVGAAATLKLALNQLLLGLVSSFGLSLAMVKAGGVPVDEFMAVVRQSSLRSPQFEKKLPRMLERDFSQPHFPLSHMLKDVELMQAEAGRLGLGDEALAGMRAAIERSISMGFGQLDYSALYNGIFPAGDEPQ